MNICATLLYFRSLHHLVAAYRRR